MNMQHRADFALTAEEHTRLARDGFLLRRNVFSAHECAAISRDCEELAARLVALEHGEKRAAGSYVFESRADLEVIVKWEPGAPNVLQGVELFAHFSEPLGRLAQDPRLVEPCKAICGAQELALFTEKLNVKRAQKGGPIVLHQDFPYWEPFTPIASRIATAMLALDDATVEKGCLEVAPGSHTSGKHPQRADAEGLGRLEMDSGAFDTSRLVPLEMPAGSVVFFGAFLVHRSLPNRSTQDRRALLYSYQPAGHPHGRELQRRMRAQKEKELKDKEQTEKAAGAH